jgi:hypothetical protein
MKKLLYAAIISIILFSVSYSTSAAEQNAPVPAPAPAPAAAPAPVPVPTPAAVPSKGGPGEAALAYGKACDELKFEEAMKLLSKAELERIKKPVMVNVNILKNIEESQRKEAVAQLGIEDKDLALPEDQLFVKVMSAKMKKEKADAEQKGEKWGLDIAFVSEKIEGDNAAVVTVRVAGGGETEIQMVKEDGAWKLASIPEKNAAPPLKKKDNSDYPPTPSAVLIKFGECMKSSDVAAAIELLSSECIKNIAADIRRHPEATRMGFTEEDLKKDDKSLLILQAEKGMEQMKSRGEARNRKIDIRVEIVEENITGDTALLKAKLFQFEGEKPRTEEFPFIRENGKWKINKMR